MKKRNSLIVVSLLVALVLTPVAYALVSRSQSISYTLTPTNNVSIQSVGLGTVSGGSSSSQTFDSAMTLSSTSGGTHTVTATLSVNGTQFSNFDVSFVQISPNGDMCDLSIGTTSCTWTVSLTSPLSYNEVISYTANDGITATGSVTVSVSMN